MKLNLQIQLPVDKKRLQEAAGERFEFKLREVLTSAEEVLGRDEKDYYVHLSKESQSGRKKLYSKVRELNQDRSSGKPLVPNTSNQPPSVSADLEKPRVDFDTFMKKLTESGKKLAEAHDRIDPQVALRVLSQ